jgi:hypothetical protein
MVIKKIVSLSRKRQNYEGNYFFFLNESVYEACLKNAANSIDAKIYKMNL